MLRFQLFPVLAFLTFIVAFFPHFSLAQKPAYHPELAAQWMIVADTNQDGYLEWEELNAWPEAFAWHLQPDNRFRADRDKDEKLSHNELLGISSEAWEFIWEDGQAELNGLYISYPHLRKANWKYCYRHPGLASRLAQNPVWTNENPGVWKKLLAKESWWIANPAVGEALSQNLYWRARNPGLADDLMAIRQSGSYQRSLSRTRKVESRGLQSKAVALKTGEDPNSVPLDPSLDLRLNLLEGTIEEQRGLIGVLIAQKEMLESMPRADVQALETKMNRLAVKLEGASISHGDNTQGQFWYAHQSSSRVAPVKTNRAANANPRQWQYQQDLLLEIAALRKENRELRTEVIAYRQTSPDPKKENINPPGFVPKDYSPAEMRRLKDSLQNVISDLNQQLARLDQIRNRTFGHAEDNDLEARRLKKLQMQLEAREKLLDQRERHLMEREAVLEQRQERYQDLEERERQLKLERQRLRYEMSGASVSAK